MYSLPAKVIEVKNDETVVVAFKDNTQVVAKKAPNQKLEKNDYVSVIRPDGEFELCGEKLIPAFSW